MKDVYNPIRIVKDAAIPFVRKEDHKRFYPHSKMETVPERRGKRLICYYAVYRIPQRINAPTEREFHALLASGCAKEIPQHKELKCDDPRSPLSGSRGRTAEHKMEAAREVTKREGEERAREELEIKPEVEPEPKPKRRRRKADDKPDKEVAKE